jgi:hypothetical protein
MRLNASPYLVADSGENPNRPAADSSTLVVKRSRDIAAATGKSRRLGAQ